MRYILKNYKNFITQSFSLYILSFITVFVSALAIFLAYGIYQNANIVWNGNYDYESENNYIEFLLSTDAGKEVTKKDLKRCFEQISDQIDRIHASGNSDHLYFDGYTTLDWGYTAPEHADQEFLDLELMATIDEYGIKAPTVAFDNLVKQDLSDGASWSDAEEEAGKRVALFWNYKEQESFDDSYPSPVCAIDDNNMITIDGKKYSIIGYQLNTFSPMIPFGSLDDNVSFHSGKFIFPEWVSNTSYETVTNILKKELGDRVEILYEDRSHEEDAHYTYSMAVMIVMLLSIIAVIDLLIIYQYYLKKNQYNQLILRICGMSKRKNICKQLGECVLLSVPVYIIAMIFWAAVILPRLTPYFVYMQNSFSFRLYAVFLGIYVLSVVLFCLFILIKNSRKPIETMLRGGE